MKYFFNCKNYVVDVPANNILILVLEILELIINEHFLEDEIAKQ